MTKDKVDTNDILNKYREIRILRTFERLIVILIPIFMIYSLSIFYNNIDGKSLNILIIFFTFFFLILITILLLGKRDDLTFFTKLYFSKILKKWGITEEDVILLKIKHEKAIEKEEKRRLTLLKEKRFLSNFPKQHLSPIVQQLCMKNPEAKEAQILFLSEIYDEEQIKEVFENEYTDSHFYEAVLYLKKRDLDDKKKLINYLFKLTIVEDGIRDDEWAFMISLMTQLKFSKSYISYFAYRYQALRTGTDYSKYEDNGTSTAEKSNADLNQYYSVLGVDKDASYEEVRKAYHSLALTHHPDLTKNASRINECEELMVKINEAYNMIVRR